MASPEPPTIQEKDVESATPQTDASVQDERDPNVVDWDGPGDPQNPLNWSMKQKATAIALVSAITFITPLASSMFAPSIDQVMAEFHSTNSLLASFIVSVYLLGYCFGPLVIAPLSEMYGRAPLFHTCNALFVVFTVACAVAPSLNSLIGFRLLAGLAGSCPLTNGAGTIADLVSPEKRGAAMAIWVAGPLFGPVVGPISGGYLAQAKDWRWSFWVIAMASGVLMLASLLFIRETYAFVILDRKTKKLRKETGNVHLRSALDTGRSPKDLFSLAILRPTKMLLFAPIVTLLSLYLAIVYGYLYLLFTTISLVFQEQYGFSTGSVGLVYLGIGVGSILGLLAGGMSSDLLVAYLKARNKGEARAEYRLPPVMVGSVLMPAGLFWYGWTADTNQHWILPIVGTGFFGCGLVISFLPISTYLVDAYGAYAASATAVSTVLRSLFGALLPLAGRDMFSALGLGWGSSLLAFIAVAMIPVPFLFYIYGERLRKTVFLGVTF